MQLAPAGLYIANRPDANTEVQRIIQDNKRVTINEESEEIKISMAGCTNINHEVPQYRED